MKTPSVFCLIRRHVLVVTLLSASLVAPPADAAVRINDNLVLNGDVFDFRISPDSSRVVWIADADANDVFELYSRAIDGGGTTVKLNGTLPANGDVQDFKISADSTRVIWRADVDADNEPDLYSRAIDGSGSPVKLSDGLGPEGSVVNYAISADSTRVVWLSDTVPTLVRELYSRAIDGSGAQVKLNDALVAGGSVAFFFQLSADSARAVWLADADTDNKVELYSRPIDGSGTMAKINNPIALANGNVDQFQISGDSTRVVWIADTVTDFTFEIFSRAIDGSGAQLTLNDPLVPGGSVDRGFVVSPDGAYVVYQADADTNNVRELYSRRIDGSGVEVKLNDPLVAGGEVDDLYIISPNSTRVLWHADADTDEVFELYSRVIDGSSPEVKLSNPMVAGGDVVNGFLFTADSSRVVWRADADIDTVLELYSRASDGSGAQVKLNTPLPAGRAVIPGPELTPDSVRAVWRADADTDNVFELYTRRLDASDAQAKVNDPLVAGGNIFSSTIQGFRISPDSTRLVYLADQITDEVFELFSATLPAPPIGPVPVASALGDVITNEFAPDGAGANDGTKFDVLRRGGYLAENGNLIFPGNLLVGTGGVTLSPNNFMGLWKQVGASLTRFARSGGAAPEASGALFDVLPTVPAINDSGEVTFLGSLVVGSGSPVTTVDTDTGLWSELGGTGIGILMREGDFIPGFSPLQVGAFASGAYATAKTGASTGEATFSIQMKNGSTDTAILRASITGANITAVGFVARENTPAPGSGENFNILNGSFSDPQRMDATGNVAFAALTKPSNKEGIWYQPVAGGAPVKAFVTGDTAPGTGGATFKNIKSPAIGSAGVITFRGLLNNNGDNAGGLRNDGIWRGTTAGGFTNILLRGDSGLPGMPGGSKVGNVWHSWLTNLNHGAWRGWLDVNGDGSSAAPADVNAIYTDLSGAMSMIVKVGDIAPGMGGVATFASFDLPVVGGAEQMAFIGNVTGGGTSAANNSGIWRSAPNGGALSLVIRTGDTITTTQGARVIQKVDFPGSGSTDRRWEQPVMDATGRLIVFVTFTSASGGGTSQILVP